MPPVACQCLGRILSLTACRRKPHCAGPTQEEEDEEEEDQCRSAGESLLAADDNDADEEEERPPAPPKCRADDDDADWEEDESPAAAPSRFKHSWPQGNGDARTKAMTTMTTKSSIGRAGDEARSRRLGSSSDSVLGGAADRGRPVRSLSRPRGRPSSC